MSSRVMFTYRRVSYAFACGLGLTLLACSGGGGDATAPNAGPPAQNPPPTQPPPTQPPTQQPPPAQNPGITGTYALMQINNSQPGQMVTVSNPDGKVIGLYRFDAGTQLSLDELQHFSLEIRYTDDKSQYALPDQGEFQQTGTAQGAVALTFTSATYGDAFSAVATDGVVAIKYDFDGDGQPDTVFAFQRVG